MEVGIFIINSLISSIGIISASLLIFVYLFRKPWNLMMVLNFQLAVSLMFHNVPFFFPLFGQILLDTDKYFQTTSLCKALRALHTTSLSSCLLIITIIKPDNFAIGLDEESTKIYLIDFGLAKKYRSSRTLEQYPLRSGKKLTGTARYASINALSGLEQSRRDDLESIGYVLIYFLKGSLPWQGLLIKKKEDRYKKILEKKQDTTANDLCSGFPKEFEEFINCTRNLGYTEEPQYDYLIGLMKNVLERDNYIFDYYVEWVNDTQTKKNEENTNNNDKGNKNITVVNKYYHQVNNIVINNTKEDINNIHQNLHMQYTKTDEAQYNENSRERVNSLSPIKTIKKTSKNNLKMQSSTKAQCSFNHHQQQEVPLYHKISSVGNNRSKCCLM